MHLYKHTKKCYTNVEPIFLNSSDCFIKVETVEIYVNGGHRKYSVSLWVI